MKTPFKVLIALLSLVASASAFAATNWVEGEHYQLIENMPRSGAKPGQIEVVEVFSYGCPACNEFVPIARKLRASLPPNVQFSYVPASFNQAEDWPMFQRAYLTAQLLGIADKAHDAMFDAVWKSGELAVVDTATRQIKRPAPSIEDAARWYAKHSNVKAADFVAAANSMTIAVKIKDAEDYIRRYRVDSTPTIIINNKYRVTPQTAGSYPAVVELVDYLVAKEQKK